MAPASSTTGEAADCELGLALGLHRENLPAGFTQLLPTLDPRSVVALGPSDAEELAAHRIPSMTNRIACRTANDLGATLDGDGRHARRIADFVAPTCGSR